MKQSSLTNFFFSKKENAENQRKEDANPTRNPLPVEGSLEKERKEGQEKQDEKPVQPVNIKDVENVEKRGLPDSPANTGLSTYEQIREENIRRNAEFLASLGLDSVMPAAAQRSLDPKDVKKKRARSPPRDPAMPARRSSRVAGLSAVDYADAGTSHPRGHDDTDGADHAKEGDDDDDVDDDDDDFDTPDVVRYILKRDDEGAHSVYLHPAAEVRRLQYEAQYSSLSLVRDDPMGTADLPAIYSLSFLPSRGNSDMHGTAPLALLAAGKGGMVSIFNDPFGRSDVAPYTFQAHTRWVSTARFLDPMILSSSADDAGAMGSTSMTGGQEGGTMLPVITASDDATVKIWDVGRAGKKKPKLLSSSNQVHSRGIFCLEVVGDAVVCGSKDKTVSVSKITPTGLSSQPLARYELHSGVVKAVDVQSSGTVFASGSQDRSVCIKDTRVGNTRSAETELTDCFGGGVFSVQFGPACDGNQHLLLAAGLDPVLKLFDLRYVKGGEHPLHAYRGHTAPGVRLKSIVPPSFVGAHTIVTGGQGSGRLSLYCANTGKTLSRGELPDDPSNCAVTIGPHGTYVASACRGDIYFLRALEASPQAGGE